MPFPANKVDTLKKEFPNVLKETLGIVSTACDKSGISRTTYYEWRHNDPQFAAACDDVQEVVIDRVETVLYHKIFKDKDTPSTLFFLKTRAKHRGYVERVENTGKDGEPIKQDYTITEVEKRHRDIVDRINATSQS